MANIFSDPLSSIRYEDLEQWATDTPVPSEGERMDCKRKFSSSLTQSIVSMGNHAGGIILVGVDESVTAGSPKSVAWPPVGVALDRCIDTLQNHCHQYIQPTYLPEYHPVAIPTMPDKAVLVIRIDPQTVPRPLWHSEKGVLFRIGDSNRPAGLDTLRRLFSLENADSALNKDYQVKINLLGRENANGTWLSCALLFAEPAKAFDSSVKRSLMNAVGKWYWVPGSPYQRKSYMGRLLMTIPSGGHASVSDFEVTMDATGVITMQARTEQNPIQLHWLFDRLSRLFAMVVEDNDINKVFGGGQIARMQIALANWPSVGVTTGQLFLAKNLNAVETLGHRVVQSYGPVPRTRDAFLEVEEAFLRDILEDSSLIDFEGRLHAVIGEWGWTGPGTQFNPTE